jgi:hypothetical protein
VKRASVLLAAAATSLAAAVAPSSARPAPPARQPLSHIIFAVTWMDGGVVEAEIVGLSRGPGVFVNPPDEDSVATARFGERWLRPGLSYHLLVAGRPVGLVTVKPSEAGGCNANAVLVRPRVATVPPGRVALAMDVAPGDGTPLRRDPTGPENAEMRSLLRQAIIRSAGANGWRYDADLRVSEVTMPHGKLLVGSAVVRLDRDDVAAPVNAAFVIAEPSESGAWRPVATWAHPASDPAADFPLSRTLLDVADLDLDGNPEIVTRTDYSEYWQYTIYRLGRHGWAAAFEASSGGC